MSIGRETHFSNIQTIKKSLKARNLRSLRERVDGNEWSTNPISVNAFFEPERNAISKSYHFNNNNNKKIIIGFFKLTSSAVPVAILQLPFFGPGRTAY